MGLNSLKIVINLYKKGKITEEEALKLIEDLNTKPANTYWYPWYYNNPYCKEGTTITATSGNENAIYTSSEGKDWKGIYWTCNL